MSDAVDREQTKNPGGLLAEIDREILAFRQRLMKGRGMLLVPESWCSPLGGFMEPWSVVAKDGIEYVVIPDKWLAQDGDGYFVKPLPEPDLFAHPMWKGIGV